MEDASVCPCVMAEAVGAEEIVGLALLISPVTSVGIDNVYIAASAPVSPAVTVTPWMPALAELNATARLVRDTSCPGNTPTKVGVPDKLAVVEPS